MSVLDTKWMAAEQDQRILETVEREQSRLRSFIRRRVADAADAEDILQDVFFELVEAYRLMKPVELVSSWLYKVARNRIIDLFRQEQKAIRADPSGIEVDGEEMTLEDLLPSPDAGPEALYARTVLLEEIEVALDELPDEQREIFIAHEVEGRSFKELAVETGLSVSTLISRKHYAVLYLRKRLQKIYQEFTSTKRRKYEKVMGSKDR